MSDDSSQSHLYSLAFGVFSLNLPITRDSYEIKCKMRMTSSSMKNNADTNIIDYQEWLCTLYNRDISRDGEFLPEEIYFIIP